MASVDFRKFNNATKKDPYPLPFSDGVLNIVVGYEAYSFLDGYLGYPKDNEISIALEDRYKMIFITDWGAFVWMVMPFGVKNGP
jgi:hypothetical protein